MYALYFHLDQLKSLLNGIVGGSNESLVQEVWFSFGYGWIFYDFLDHRYIEMIIAALEPSCIPLGGNNNVTWNINLPKSIKNTLISSKVRKWIYILIYSSST